MTGPTGWNPGGGPNPPASPPGWAEPTGAWPTGQPVPPAWPAGAQGFSAPGGASGGVPFGAPQPPRNRKPLIIGLSVGAVVLVLVVVAAVVLLTGGSSAAGKPGDAVKGYLEALAAGDAEKALSYSGDQPGSKDFLTDEILKKQIDKWPITEIKILDSDGGAYSFGQVHVSAKFGDQTSDVTMSVKKSGKSWKLDHATIKVDPSGAISSNSEAYKTLELFGQKIGDKPAYVFPGWIDATSDNPNLQVNIKEPLLLKNLSITGVYWGDFDFVLSDKGNSAITSAIKSAMQACARSTQLSPPNCPQRVYEYELVDGTAAWGTPDISGIKIDYLDGSRLEARFSGQVVFPLTAKTRSGDNWTGKDSAYVSGTADLTQNPPKVTIS